MVYLSYMIIWAALVDTLVTSAESTNKIVSCAACQVTSSFSAWECDVKCNVAPDGSLIYGESIFRAQGGLRQLVATNRFFLILQHYAVMWSITNECYLIGKLLLTTLLKQGKALNYSDEQ